MPGASGVKVGFVKWSEQMEIGAQVPVIAHTCLKWQGCWGSTSAGSPWELPRICQVVWNQWEHHLIKEKQSKPADLHVHPQFFGLCHYNRDSLSYVSVFTTLPSKQPVWPGWRIFTLALWARSVLPAGPGLTTFPFSPFCLHFPKEREVEFVFIPPGRRDFEQDNAFSRTTVHCVLGAGGFLISGSWRCPYLPKAPDHIPFLLEFTGPNP